MNQLDNKVDDKVRCEQAFQRLNDYLDKELSPEETKAIEEHIAVCEWCAKTYKYEAELLQEIKQKVQRVPVSSGLLARVSNALKQAQSDPSSKS